MRTQSISNLPFLGKKICLSLFLVVLFGFCFPRMTVAAAPTTTKTLVAATILPLGDFCRQLGGKQVEVLVLVPPGASPHVFEPPPSVIARAARARVFVYTGAGLEPWAEKLLRSRDPRNLEVVEAVRGIPLLRDVEEDHHGEGAHEKHEGQDHHHHAGGNPHVWLDPVLAQGICRRITAALIKVDPEHRAAYEANLQSYLKKLEALHQEIARRVSAWRQKDFVCFHPAYSYFARRYGLRQVGVIELSPGREPTPRHLQRIVAAIKKHGIKVVFAEPQLNPRVAEVIAREAGVKVLLLDPMGGRPPYGGDYLKLMRYNLAILDEAMK
jgi:zinc transport system substrate-binding protein